jgi:hypothetical protein
VDGPLYRAIIERVTARLMGHVKYRHGTHWRAWIDPLPALDLWGSEQEARKMLEDRLGADVASAVLDAMEQHGKGDDE